MRRFLFFLFLPLFPWLAPADDRIERALSLSQRINKPVYRDSIKPQWLPDGNAFWYRIQTGPQTHEVVLINAETGERQSAATLAELDLTSTPIKSSDTKNELRKSSRQGESSGLTFINQLKTAIKLFWINPKGEQIAYGNIPPGEERRQHTFDGHVWLVTSEEGEQLSVIEAQALVQTIIIDGKGRGPSENPPETSREKERKRDHQWSAFLENGLVMLRDKATDKSFPVKTSLDGKSPFRGRISWSPDSSAFVACHSHEVPTRKITIVDSSPRDQLQPKLREFSYAKPGDELPNPLPVIFHINEGNPQYQIVANDLFPTPFKHSADWDIRWSDDGTEFYFDYNQRGHQIYRILAVNASTGTVRVVVEETSQTFIDYQSKTWRHWLPGTNELLWMSERDGWCHLWLYDTKTGTVKNQITKGQWPVRNILHVDEQAREIWFMASGLNPNEDPYHQHLCRVNFDGSGFKNLTESDGNHQVTFSPDRRFFNATWSRVDHPPVHELRRSSDGGLVCIVEKADATELLSSGWTRPERFVAKGRDGKTDIHGILIKPTHFDSAKQYPIVEDIYAGPQSAFVPKKFERMTRQRQIAELGFIVVQIDGMGTNHRGKAFHDVCWKNLKDAGFPDRIAWIKAAAETRPWMDLKRVGIFGGSAGGQNAMRALLDHNDFYHVAVADCGCHDNRMDKIWWNEQWMGWPVDESYAKNSNTEDAHKLQGDLLLIVGELDNNVDPSSTLQVVGALQKAGKRFEFMPMINTGHGAAESAYGSRLRMEFLVRHLLDQTPH